MSKLPAAVAEQQAILAGEQPPTDAAEHIFGELLPDEPILSVGRCWQAIRVWVYFQLQQPPIDLPFWSFLFYFHRPNASHRAGRY